MKLHKDYYGYCYPNQSQKTALTGLLVVLFPAFLPNLFGPLSHTAHSIFSSVDQQSKLWAPLPNHGWKHCPEEPNSLSSSPKESTGYIQVFLDEGLNQQKMGICDAVAVAVAKILNATLVIPHLEVNPVWQDSSSFEDIFDVDHFIEALQGEVSIVKALPSEFSWSTREYYATGIRITRIKTAPVHASSDWYLENVLPLLQRYGVAAISPFSHRLAFDNLPQNIQRVSCKVNFQALAFVPHIRELGETLVNRLRYPPNGNPKGGSDSQDKANEIEKQGAGKYDIAAHSACDFGGGKAEKLALAKYRQVIWQGRVLNSQFTDEELRNQGRCPLTPEEIGLLLAALGFNNTTRLYLASYKVGHRAYMNLKTIRPNMALSGKLFVNKSMEWSDFQRAPSDGHKTRQGQMRLRKDKQSIYTYPAPDCMCRA
ncbi:hypothetical protein DVH24_033543 [Malus domestica]|uniref:O-fucosyltransferase family protein n=1 Tax=Malus domestica TaxID=3750 RepID=A0A498JCV5_MALDO|nr:hypothetical protein DVH24_033543 [Malus domestica]